MKKLSPKGKKILALCLLVVIAVCVALATTFAIGHVNGPSKVVKTFFNSFNQRDFDAFCSCYLPKDQPTLREAAQRLGGPEEFFDQNYNTMFGEGTPYSDFGTDIKLLVSDLETEAQTITDGKYNGVDVERLKVSAVSTVVCDVTTKGSSKEVTERVQVLCFKSEGKWHIYNMVNLPDEVPETSTDVK